jgi:hypothetical protein
MIVIGSKSDEHIHVKKNRGPRLLSSRDIHVSRFPQYIIKIQDRICTSKFCSKKRLIKIENLLIQITQNTLSSPFTQPP